MSRGENEELSASTSVCGNNNYTNHSNIGADLDVDLNVLTLEDDCALEKTNEDLDASAFPDFSGRSSSLPEFRAMWSEPSSYDVPVRGATYMSDRVKVPAGESVGSLLHVDLWTTPTPEQRHHIALVDLQRSSSVIRYCQDTHPDSLVFILNIELPDANNVSLVSYWLVPPPPSPSEDEGKEANNIKKSSSFHKLLRRFVDGEQDDDDNNNNSDNNDSNCNNAFRDQRFKLIPHFTQAPWLLNQLVQSRPALTGQKLTQRYFRGANYVEVDLDVSSSTLSHYIGSLCQNWASYIEVDVFITVQGEEAEELPEKILGGVRIAYMDLSLARPIHSEAEEEKE